MKKLFAIFLISGAAVLFLNGCSRGEAQNPEPHHFTITPGDDTAIGFNLYCGQQSGVYTQNHSTLADGINTVTIPVLDVGLPDGINFCAARAYNFVGESNGYSNEVEVPIQNGDLILAPPSAPGLGVS
jgi:hypothetical protein